MAIIGFVPRFIVDKYRHLHFMTPWEGQRCKPDEAFIFHRGIVSPQTGKMSKDDRWPDKTVLYLVFQDNSDCPGFTDIAPKDQYDTPLHHSIIHYKGCHWWKLTRLFPERKDMKHDTSEELKHIARLEDELKELRHTVEEKTAITAGNIVRFGRADSPNPNMLRILVATGRRVLAIDFHGNIQVSDSTIEELVKRFEYTKVAKDLEEYIRDN